MSYNRGTSPPTRRVDPRTADALADTYHSHRHNSSVLPYGSSARVIPLTTETYVNSGPPSGSGASRSTASGYDSYVSSRSGRRSPVESPRTSTSGSARTRANVVYGERTTSPVRDDGKYYIRTIGSRATKEGRGEQKVYVREGGGVKLVSEEKVEILPDGSYKADNRSHKPYKHDRDTEERAPREGSRSSYAASRRASTIDDADAFSYTDAASMYRDTEPSWRPRDSRARRNSAERNDYESKTEYGMDLAGGSRRSRDYGPPVSTRGWDKINDGVGRTKSMREGPRQVDHSPNRGRDGDRYRDPRDPYYIAPRHESSERSKRNVDAYDKYDSDERREPQHRERRLSVGKPKDRSVSRRGFGIRSNSREAKSVQRSDESLDSYARDDYPSSRRDYASDTEQTSKRRSKYSDNHGQRDRDYSPDEQDRERRRRRDDDRDRQRRDDSDSRGPSAVATAGGLAAAGAAAYGLSASRATGTNHDRSRNSDAPRPRYDERTDRDVERRKDNKSSNAPYPADDADGSHGLGFAFETPAGLPDRTRVGDKADTSRDVSQDNRKNLERTHEDVPPALSDNAPVDPDEEYRRRIQQARRELGLSAGQPSDDATREQRRKERESRLQQRREHGSIASASAGASPDRSPIRSSFDSGPPSTSGEAPSARPDLQRRASIVDDAMPPPMGAVILDNSQSDKRETRVRIVDPPTEEEERKPKGILKRPTQKFPEDPNVVREGVAPLKDVSCLNV